jgi:hypothetical protein
MHDEINEQIKGPLLLSKIDSESGFFSSYIPNKSQKIEWIGIDFKQKLKKTDIFCIK